jgi:spoIIIJ-associated protein
MKRVQRQGSSLEKIIKDFKAEHSLHDDDFSFEIVQEGKRGLWGLFGKMTIVDFILKDYDNEIVLFIKQIGNYIDIAMNDVVISKKDNYTYVDVNKVSEPGFLIGKDGKFLHSLQYLLNQAFLHKDKKCKSIILDIEGYKDRQDNHIVKKVKYLAEQCLRTQRSVTLDPMNPAQRRVVHQTIKNIPDIRTMTIGDGQMKRIVISPGKAGKYDNKKNYKRPTL